MLGVAIVAAYLVALLVCRAAAVSVGHLPPRR